MQLSHITLEVRLSVKNPTEIARQQQERIPELRPVLWKREVIANCHPVKLSRAAFNMLAGF